MLKTYDLATLNARAKNDPKGFIEESEAAYLKQIDDTAELLGERLADRPILLLNGPSSAGMTVCAVRLSVGAFAASAFLWTIIISAATAIPCPTTKRTTWLTWNRRSAWICSF